MKKKKKENKYNTYIERKANLLCIEKKKYMIIISRNLSIHLYITFFLFKNFTMVTQTDKDLDIHIVYILLITGVMVCDEAIYSKFYPLLGN